jgi:hypothetical protein
MTAVSLAHVARSDDFFRDAQSDYSSPRGRRDAAFESGYFALLSVLTPAERDLPDHPHANVITLGAARVGISPTDGLRFAHARYAFDDRPELTEVLAWATDIRVRVRALASAQNG